MPMGQTYLAPCLTWGTASWRRFDHHVSRAIPQRRHPYKPVFITLSLDQRNNLYLLYLLAKNSQLLIASRTAIAISLGFLLAQDDFLFRLLLLLLDRRCLTMRGVPGVLLLLLMVVLHGRPLLYLGSLASSTSIIALQALLLCSSCLI